MNQSPPSYLRLHSESAGVVVAPSCEAYAGLPQLCAAFEQAVGWALHYADDASLLDESACEWITPLQAYADAAPAYLWMSSNDTLAGPQPAPHAEAAGLASCIADLLNELLERRHVSNFDNGEGDFAAAWEDKAMEESLLDEGRHAVRLRRQLSAAERLQKHQLPHVAPLLSGWELAGWSTAEQRLGGACHDWLPLDGASFGLLLVEAEEQGLPGALTSQAMRTSLRTQAEHGPPPQLLLQRANRSLWTGSAGDQTGQAFFARCETETGFVGYAAAGKIDAWHLKPRQVEKLAGGQPGLGRDPESRFALHHLSLLPGEALIALTGRMRQALDAAGRPLDVAALAAVLVDHRHLSAQELVELVRAQFELHAADAERDDYALLVVKRRA